MRRYSLIAAVMLIVLSAFFEICGIELDGGAIKAAEAIVSGTENGECIMEGRVTKAVLTESGKGRLIVDCGRSGRVMVYVNEGSGECYSLPGKMIRMKAVIRMPEPASNPGTFDNRNYLRSQKIYLTASCSMGDIEALGIYPSLFKGYIINGVSQFRYSFYTRLRSAAGEDTAGLFSGMLFGGRDLISSDMYDSFKENGTAHILSVSGLHVGIIYGMILLVMGKRRRSRLCLIVTVAAMSGCLVMASFSVSVIRAVLMISLSIAAERTERRYDLISAACAVVIFLLIDNPAVIYSTGFILSFSAVISLAVIGGGIRRRIKSDSLIVRIMTPVAAIQLGMIPVSAYYFNSFSAAAFISNLPVIFLSAIILPLGMCAAGLSLLTGICPPFGALFDLAADICGFMGDMMIFFNDVSGAFGKLAFRVPSPSVFVVAGFYVLLFMLFSEHFSIRKPDVKRIAAGGAVVLILMICAGAEELMRPEVVFLDVGQGDCIHVKTHWGKNYLIDGGGSVFGDTDVGREKILPYLLKNNAMHLDGVFISHMDADHYKGIASLMEEVEIDRVYMYEGYKSCIDGVVERLNMEDDSRLVFLKKGDRVILEKNLYADVIYPLKKTALSFSEEEESGDLNSNCMVLKLNIGGTEILLTGDIGEEQEKELAKNADISCDIIKVPHHGSRYSSSDYLVDAAGCSAAVIQVGYNNFGHPAESVIERYSKKGIIILRNDRDGAVAADIKRGGYRIFGVKSGEEYEF